MPSVIVQTLPDRPRRLRCRQRKADACPETTSLLIYWLCCSSTGGSQAALPFWAFLTSARQLIILLREGRISHKKHKSLKIVFETLVLFVANSKTPGFVPEPAPRACNPFSPPGPFDIRPSRAASPVWLRTPGRDSCGDNSSFRTVGLAERARATE